MKFLEYLKQPATVWKIAIGIFVMGTTYSTLSFGINSNNERLNDIEGMNYDVTIMQMQTDIAWIRKALESG